MTPLIALLNLEYAGEKCADADARASKAHHAFGKIIAKERKQSRAEFARKLGVTGSMLALMETGKRRWPIRRAKLAVKLLTRRDNWPDPA